MYIKMKGCYNSIMKKRSMKKGFTLVELSLSMVFVGILSLMVVFVIMNAVSSYRKSITLNNVDTIGMSLVEDMRRSIQDSSPSDLKFICESYTNSSACDNSITNFVSVTRKADVAGVGNVPVFGAFCTGNYSYIWNSGYFFNDGQAVSGVSAAVLWYKDESGAVRKTEDNYDTRDFRMLKVKDKSRAVCIAAVRVAGNSVTNNYTINNSRLINNGSNVFNIALDNVVPGEEIKLSDSPEIILSKESGLSIYNFSSNIAMQQGFSKNLFYYASFVLGTLQGGANLTATGDYCARPQDYSDDYDHNFDYCSVNKFNFAATANGGQNV